MTEPTNVAQTQGTADSPEGQDQSRKAKIKAFAKEGAYLLGKSAVLITSRMLTWAVVGGVFGLVIWTILFWTGYMEIESIPIKPLIYQLTFLFIYLIVGALALGYVGVWRGIGRTVIYVGIKKGFVLYLLDEILDKFVNVLRKSGKFDQAMDNTRLFLEDLPLQTWEDNLKATVAEHLQDDDTEAQGLKKFHQWLLRQIRRFLTFQIEFFLLGIVRQEVTSSGGGGISIQQVREIALVKINSFIEKWIVGLMNKQLVLGFLILIGLYALVPLIAYYF